MQALICSIALSVILGSTSASVVQPETRRVAIAPMLSLELPRGYQAVITRALPDAWFGEVLNADGRRVLSYSVGTVEKAITAGNRSRFRWVKKESVKAGDLEYGLEDQGGEVVLKAVLSWANFVSVVHDETEVRALLGLLRTAGESCGTCEQARFEAHAK